MLIQYFVYPHFSHVLGIPSIQSYTWYTINLVLYFVYHQFSPILPIPSFIQSYTWYTINLVLYFLYHHFGPILRIPSNIQSYTWYTLILFQYLVRKNEKSVLEPLIYIQILPILCIFYVRKILLMLNTSKITLDLDSPYKKTYVYI